MDTKTRRRSTGPCERREKGRVGRMSSLAEGGIDVGDTPARHISGALFFSLPLDSGVPLDHTRGAFLFLFLFSDTKNDGASKYV